MTTVPPAPHPQPTGAPVGRRPLAAGNIVLVMLVAALVGGLLNAAGIRKTADSQPVGLRRDLARIVAEPLFTVSHALHVDALRSGLQSITGRSGDDTVNGKLPDPTVHDVVPAPTVKRAFNPIFPASTWIGGDSLSITPGESFVAAAADTQVISVVGGTDDGHVATGLARPEVFNWSQHIADVIASDNPNAMVLTIGSNDDQVLTGDGGVGPYASAEWVDEYRRRVGGIMDQVTGSGKRTLFWLGVPPIRTRADDRYQPINDIIREEAAKRPGRVVYLDLDQRFRGPDGGYADALDGTVVRTPDGVHFTRDGANIVAQMILDAMNQTYDLQSWRTRTTTSAGGHKGSRTPAGTPTTTAAK